MQEKRQLILEILRDVKQATVDEIVAELKHRNEEITSVTVRHHLSRLQELTLVNMQQLRHRNSPGRPQHVYELTEKARGAFPNNYQQLASNILQGLRDNLPPDSVNVILEGVADNMATEANLQNLPFDERLDQAIIYLNEHGYEAHCEPCDEGYILYTANCPYHELVKDSDDGLCDMDMRLISSLIGIVPRLQSRISEGANSCTYLIPVKT